MKASGCFAPSAIDGVNEKQPLRGIIEMGLNQTALLMSV